jgi:hypothetical protein
MLGKLCILRSHMLVSSTMGWVLDAFTAVQDDIADAADAGEQLV